MDVYTLDFETYYDKDFSLSKITTEEYVRSPEFETIGLGIKKNDGPTYWLAGEKRVAHTLSRIDWSNAAILCHNTMFDGAILSWRYGVKPKVWFDTLCMARAIHGVEKSASLKALAEKYEVGEKGDEVINALGKRLVDFTKEELARYGEYCRNDVDLTYTIFNQMLKKFPKQELKLIDHTLRMYINPILELDGDLLEMHLQKTKLMKEDLLTSSGATKEDLMSNAKLAAILREYGAEVPMKISPTTGKLTYAMAKNDEEFKALAEHEDFRVQAVVAARLGTKSTLEETRTQRFIDISKRGALPVPVRYYAAHCLTGDAEVLTPDGWVRLDVWGGGPILNWDDTGVMEFHPSTANKFYTIEPIIQYSSHYHKASYTFGHTIPTFSGRRVFTAMKAGVAMTKRFELPIAGLSVGYQDISKLQVQVAVMVQADGSISEGARGRAVRFGFKKERKAIRCRELLTAIGVPYTEATEPTGVVRIRVGADHVNALTALVSGKDKLFSTDLYAAPCDVKCAFIDELALWDGWEESAFGIAYVTTNKHNAELVQTIAHMAGKSARVTTRVHKNPNWATLYRVHIRYNNTTRVIPTHAKEQPYEGYVFCPSTHTGYFMFRQNGCIAITGNTGRWGGDDKINLQNLPSRGPNAKVLKRAIIAPEGMTIIESDSAQIEARVLAWLAEQDDLVEAFAEGKDVYKKMAAKIYSVAETEVTKEQRFVGKTTILGAGYGMGGPKFQAALMTQGMEVTQEEAKRIITIYRDESEQITNLWKRAGYMLRALANGEVQEFGRAGVLSVDPEGPGVVLPSGLILRYDGLRGHQNADGTEYTYQTRKGPNRIYGGKVIENVCQAIARCIIGDQMLRIAKKYRAVLTVHDSIVCCVPDDEVAEAKAWVEQSMRWVPEWAAGLPVNCEAGVGKNYGDCE